MPIPAGAGVIAAVVHFSAGDPMTRSWTAITWMLHGRGRRYLMVSTWRFYSFKDIDFRSRQPFRLIVSVRPAVCRDLVIFSQWVLFVLALTLHVLRSVLAFAVDFPAQERTAASSAYKEAPQTS